MNELGKALQAIFDKLGDFFDILDLSFLVSGVATTGALIFWYYFAFGQIPFELSGTIRVVRMILVCYINGLISFSTGRWVRQIINNVVARFYKKEDRKQAFSERFRETLLAHGLEDHPKIKAYLTRTEETSVYRLYVRLWAELRHEHSIKPSLSLVKRYWVMAATYDGLSTSIAIWFLLLLELTIGFSGGRILPLEQGAFFMVLSVVFYIASLREAGRYSKYQMEDMVGSLAAFFEQAKKEKD